MLDGRHGKAGKEIWDWLIEISIRIATRSSTLGDLLVTVALFS